MKNIVENQCIKNDKPVPLSYEQLKARLDAVVAENGELISALRCVYTTAFTPVQPSSFLVQPGFFDDDNGRWLRNNRATWEALLAHVIEKPKHPPCPEYRGAPRDSEAHHEE